MEHKNTDKPSEADPVFRPLTETESLVLDVMRYKQHVNTVSDIEKQIIESEQELEKYKSHIDAVAKRIQSLQEQAFLFSAEACDQVDRLIKVHKLSKSAIDSIAVLPERSGWYREQITLGDPSVFRS